MPALQPPKEHDASLWFTDHFEKAAGEAIEFLESDGIRLRDAVLADVGSGDGITDLGLALKAAPEKLVGYDIRATDRHALQRSMSAAGIGEAFPDEDRLAFVESGEDSIPAPNETFDVVLSWSVFEHVSEPVAMLREIRRILKPHGVLFLQIWPLFNSQHGGHLWMSISEPFAHLLHSPFELEHQLKGKAGTDPTRSADDEFRSLNRITLDGLQRALLASRLQVAKIDLTAETVHIPAALSHLPLSDLAISGVKLLATPV